MRKHKKWTLRLKIIYGILSFQMVLLAGYGAVNVYGTHLLNKMNRDDGREIIHATQVFDTDEVDEDLDKMDPEDVEMPTDNFKGRTKDGVYNILLMGEDHDKSSENYRGNTDAMIVATIDTNEHEVKLTSFMRDMYVAIPGYSDNRLNSIYALGGIQLVYEAFIANFDLYLDGYVLVNFNTFEQVIDELGGVKITLNKEEAEYLNTTNYISKESNRTVVVGTQEMNGNQALGFSRIRYVGNSDYRRTERQREVLTAIFEKFRSKNIKDMLTILNSVLPHVKTDLSAAQMKEVAMKALTSNLKDIKDFRVPVDGAFSGANIRGMSVLVVDFEANINAVHEFIFGDDYEETLTSNGGASAKNNQE